MRLWRWLTARVTPAPRRITIALWLLIFSFSPLINRMVFRYRGPLMRADEWLLAAMVPLGVLLFGWIWHGRQRERR